MISVENLSKRYGQVQAIDDISFEVAKGEVLGFLGPNGAGKSTTMKALTGFHGTDKGKISIDGQDIRENYERAKLLIGYLPENNPLYEDHTVLEMLRFAGEIRGLSGQTLSDAIHKNIVRFGLTEKATNDIGTLSKGFKQRVGLALANLHDPPILILDEPTSGLDPNQIVEIRDLIREIGKTKTVILSTHNLPEVEATCTRILIIHRGRIVANDTPQALAGREQGKVVYLQVKAESCTDADFADISGVKQVNKYIADSGYHGFALVCEKNSDPREKLFDLCAGKGWKLVEIRQEMLQLEEVFAQLTKN